MSTDRIMETLQDLAQRARDSEQGYRQSADDIDDAGLKMELERLARERAEMGDELDNLIRQRGGEPPSREGSGIGQMHRTWADLKSAITGGDRQSVLREVARGESAAEASYDASLREDLPADVRAIVERQHVRVRETRNRFRALAGNGGLTERSGSYMAESEHFMQRRPILTSMTAFCLGVAVGVMAGSAMGGGNHRQGHRQDYRPSY